MVAALMPMAQCWRCERMCPRGVDETRNYYDAYTSAHVTDEGLPCAERFDYYTEEDQEANLEALLAEVDSW